MKLPVSMLLQAATLNFNELKLEDAKFKAPSLPEIMAVLHDVLTIFSEGGPKAIAFLFIINLTIIGTCVYFLAKFVWKLVKDVNDDKEKALAAKDELLNAARQRSEAVAKQYAKLATQSIEREQLLMNELRELKTFVMLFIKK